MSMERVEIVYQQKCWQLLEQTILRLWKDGFDNIKLIQKMNIQFKSFNTMCRTCMRKFEANELVPVFENKNLISQKLLFCTKIKIQPTDLIPQQICTTCLNNLDIAYNFINACRQSEDLFKNYLSIRKQILEGRLHNKESIDIKGTILEDPYTEPELKNESTLVEQIDYTSFAEDSHDDDEENNTSLQQNKNATAPDSPIKSTTQNICEICGKGFNKLIGLELHIKRHEDTKPFKCKECPKAYRERGSLKIHLRTHTGERPYACEYCSKTFKERCVLRNHLRSHTGETPFKCEYCGKLFKTRSTHCKHTASHRNERKFVCTICNAAFNLKRGLRRHQLTHTDERPYNCEVCNKGFKQTKNLKVHMRIHNNELPYTCEICATSFRYNSILKSHLESKHNIKVPAPLTLAEMRY